MAKGINIEIGVDPKKALDGIDSTEQALEKVANTLDDLGKSGDKDLEKIDKSLKEIDKEAIRTGESMKRNVGKKTTEAADEAKVGMEDLKSESLQTARETAASFDGSTESIIDMFQEVSANAFIGFGVAGTAAGLAAAAGIGLVGNVIQSIAEEAKATETRISTIANELIGVSGVGERASSVIREGITKIITGGDGAVKKLEEVKKASGAIGIEWQTVAQAYAGNEDAIDGVIKATEKQIERVDDARTSAKDFTAEDEQGYIDRKQALNNYLEEFKKTQDEINAAKEAEKAFLESGGAEMLAKEDMIASLNDAYDSAAGSILDFLNKESGVIDTDAYIQAMKDKETALLDYQNSVAKAGFTTDQKKALDAMGLESAAAFMTAYKNGTAAQKKDLAAILTKTASDSSGAAKDIIDDTFKAPIDASVKTTVDQASVEAAKKAIQNGIDAGSYKIKVTAYDRYGKAIDG